MRSKRRRIAILLLAATGLLGLWPAVFPGGAGGFCISIVPKALAAIDGGPDMDSRGLDGNDKSLQRAAAAPSGVNRLLRGLADSGLGRRVRDAAGWIASFFRFLWAIPKALIHGDSRSMIEALGDLLSRTSPASSEAKEPKSTDPQPVGRGPGSPDRRRLTALEQAGWGPLNDAGVQGTVFSRQRIAG